MAKKVENQGTERKKNRIPQQGPGMPRGTHIMGFKGTKTDEKCNCGGCNPNAKANHGRPIVLRYK